MVPDQLNQLRRQPLVERPAAADADPLVAQRCPCDRPAGVGLANHVLVGHEQVVEEHLVEIRATGHLPQWPHLDLGGLHVDDHRGDAGVLGRLGVGTHSGQAACAVVRPTGPHLLPVDLPPAVHPGGPGLDGRGVRAGFGLGEQLAPDLVFAERLLDESFYLPRRSVLDQGQNHPAGDSVVRALDARVTELLLDDQLLHRVGGQPPRLGPVWHHVSRLDQLVALCLLVQRGDLGGVSTNPGAQILGLWRQVQAVLPNDTGGRVVEHVAGRRVTTEQCRRHQRSAQVQMRVVLPGETDTAMHLDVQFRIARVRRKRQRRCRSGRQPELGFIF